MVYTVYLEPETIILLVMQGGKGKEDGILRDASTFLCQLHGPMPWLKKGIIKASRHLLCTIA